MTTPGSPAANLPIGQGLTPTQWEAWFTANTKKSQTVVSSTTYHGTQLKGKSWAQVFDVIYNYGVAHNVAIPPQFAGDSLADAAAAATVEQATLDGVAIASGDAALSAASATSASAQGIIKAANENFGLPTLPNPLAFLQGLIDPNLWIRVVKIIAGGVLVFIGVSHMTGLDNKVSKAAVKAAPFLI